MIAGLQKMTLLDFPGKVACTVFLQGCNFRCPFCHNSDLLSYEGEEFMTREAFLKFLQGRKGLLDGVAITGGEPTCQKELPELMRGIKELGFAVKLDTNGMNPELLEALVQEGLVDYVAMDVKNSPSRYAETVGLPRLNLEKIEKSLKFLISGQIDYELRTTLVAQFHTGADIEEMGKWISGLVPGKKPRQLFLQSFVDRDSVTFSGLSAPEAAEIVEFREILTPYVEAVFIRGAEIQ